ncbi:MAG: hypothetical protein ACT4N1_06615 [Nitrososphaerota archaeon]
MEIKELRDKILEAGSVTSCAVMVIEKNGDIIEYLVTDPTKTLVTLSDLVEIASLIALRYGIVGFDKLLGGLRLTIDEFRDHTTVSTSIEKGILVTVVPNTVNLNNAVGEIKKILSIELKNKDS